MRNALSARHVRQIVRRSQKLRERMRSVWGLSWRPGGYGHSFCGNLFRPLGCAVLMAQVSHQSSEGHDQISLFGISAEMILATRLPPMATCG
jgi:hypothetical protein